MRPREPLYPVHFTIELAVTETAERYGQLVDKEVEFVYELYRKYFMALRQGKTPPEPSSTQKLRGILIDNIWDNLLDLEDNASLVRSLTDGSFAPAGKPVTTMEEVYVMAFNDLRKSVRFWRKREGAKGYIHHITEHVHEVVEHGINPLEHEEEAPGSLDFLDPDGPPTVGWLKKERGYELDMGPSRLETPTGFKQADKLLEKIIREKLSIKKLFKLTTQLRKEITNLLVLDQEWLRLVADPGNYDPQYDDEVRELLARYPNNPSIVCNYLRAYVMSLGDGLRHEEASVQMAREARRIGFPAKISDFDALPNGKYDPMDFFQYHNLATMFALLDSPPDEHRAARYLDDLLRVNPPLDSVQGATNAFLSVCVSRFLALGDEEEEIETPARFPDTPRAAAYIEFVWETMGDDLELPEEG